MTVALQRWYNYHVHRGVMAQAIRSLKGELACLAECRQTSRSELGRLTSQRETCLFALRNICRHTLCNGNFIMLSATIICFKQILLFIQVIIIPLNELPLKQMCLHNAPHYKDDNSCFAAVVQLPCSSRGDRTSKAFIERRARLFARYRQTNRSELGG